ncbi:(R)-mandelonitrile lyase [Acuticoccus kandeliae]|uniref:(R)-mandelonitrile lyase n=1 Tax=Acuticoccus kandeliae TaxID=2073160 RepID=UPI000D3E7595|nr:cupin domain-containing protein [Acuticoccus kandeliae]
MKIVRSGEVPSVKASPQSFTGTVWQIPIIRAEDPARVGAAMVTFLPGARTNWHHHPLGQTLLVTSGLGWFQTEGQEKIEIRPGDTIWIPPGEKHWHGATDTVMMSHIAIHEREGSDHVTWLEPVTDEQYLGK